ncbi:hypothetical protein [Dactylosporangium sp. CA-092794]|uniref:hypothetical protein n=1 Tax=Dactylosporangium sp. CA-092794 TaxID=3239929 RepID=UPI003D901FEC
MQSDDPYGYRQGGHDAGAERPTENFAAVATGADAAPAAPGEPVETGNPTVRPLTPAAAERLRSRLVRKYH